MAKLDLSKYGITGTTEIIHNPSYEQLFAEETKPELQGFEKGQDTELSAVNVMTGIYTGRSPKDKFLVKDATSENTVWWTSEEYKNDNKPVTEGTDSVAIPRGVVTSILLYGKVLLTSYAIISPILSMFLLNLSLSF